MKKLTSILLIALPIIVEAQQKIDLRLSKTDKTVITGIGAATTVYGVMKKGYEKKDIYICSAGTVFAALPYIFEKPILKRFEVSGSGINIKLKYDKKYKKCKHENKKNKRGYL